MALLDDAVKAIGGMLGQGQEGSRAGAPDSIKDAEEFYEAALNEQKQFHPRWYRNLAFLMGQQWLDWSVSQNWFNVPPAPSWRVRLVINLIKPKVRAEVAKILRNNPSFATIPSNGTEEAKAGAKIGNRLLESIYYEDDFQRKLYNLTMWFCTVTSSFLWSIHNPRLGRKWEETQKDPMGQPIIDPNTGQPVKMEMFEGGIMHDVSGPFETLLEPGAAEDFNEHTRIMRVKIRTVEYIKDKYGIDIPPEDLSQEAIFQRKISCLGTMTINRAEPMGNKATKGVAMVKEFFELPTSKFPEGRHFAYANKRYLIEPEEIDTWLHGIRALPVGKFDHVTIPGCAWSQSLVDDCAPLNELFNKMTSQVVENANLFSRPKVLAPEGSLAENVFTDEPGEVVEYVPIGGKKPEPYKPAEMPQYFFLMKDSLPGLIDRVSGVHDVSEGRLPRRATSGKAISLLQDADDSSIGLTTKNFGSSLERVMSITLSTYGRKTPETRLIKQLGPSHQLDVFNFKGADLIGADSVRVVIVPSMNRGDKVDIAMKLAEAGMIPGEMAMKIMELGDLNIIYDREADQIQYAEFENMGMAKGIMYPVGQMEKHKVHIQSHKRFLNSPQVQNLPPEIKQTIEAHVREHEALDLLAEQQLGMAPSGPVSPGPGAPPEGMEGAEGAF